LAARRRELHQFVLSEQHIRASRPTLVTHLDQQTALLRERKRRALGPPQKTLYLDAVRLVGVDAEAAFLSAS